MSEERKSAEEFASRLSEIYGRSLVSVVLYGSAARGEYRPGLSDINLLVILDDLRLAHLQRGAHATREWVASGNPPPMMLSAEEWWNSADVFPLEYSDIRDAHVVLVGRDPFNRTRIGREHLRLQVEHELRSKKIQLREGYLVAGESPEEIGQLLIRSLPTFLTLFRAILRLDGKPIPRDRRDLIDAAGSLAGFRPAPVVDVLHARSAEEPFVAPLDGPVAAGYLEAVERCAVWLDSGEVGTGLGAEV
ncbi:MAG: nucleotidyltransferase domain-containing protein [Gemmatimonadota bacterium]